jgi:TP901 family phage tail tape measure protein
MTSRAVFIDLKARTAQYQRAMKKAENATTGVQKSLGQIFTGAAKLGVVGAAVGVAAIGAAAIKVGVEAAQAFSKFEQTMSRIVGLVGISKDVVDGFSESIKKISVATARGPQELAEALFFITSAGLEGKDALDALEASAKAAAAGLGDTATIADVVTSAVNAYGPAMGGAAVATDVLVATVREGKAEAASLSSAMGRVIPIASQMGISFDQVGAAIAAMTRVGLDANEASTALKGIMNSLLKPTTDAGKALDEVGLSARGLREEIREKGLLSALQTITTAFEGQDDATVRVFGNVRALTGVLSLMGSNADATAEIFGELADSTGALDSAFGAAADTGAFAFEQARVRIENAILEVGEKILPKLADAVDDIAPLLPDLIAGFGDLAIVLVDIGSAAIPAVSGALRDLQRNLIGVNIVMLKTQRVSEDAVHVMDILFGPWANLAEVFSDAEANMLAFNEVQIKTYNAMSDGVDPMETAKLAMRDLAETFNDTPDNLAAIQRQLSLTNDEWAMSAIELLRNADLYGLTGSAASSLEQSTQNVRTQLLLHNAALREGHTPLGRTRSAMEDLEDATDGASGAMDGFVLPLNLVRDALEEAEAANRSLADAMLELTNPTFKAVKAVEALDKAEADLEKIRKTAGKRVTVEEAEAIARAELAVVEATLRAQGALDAFGFDPANLEASIGIIQTVLGKSREEAILLLETLGVLDGTQITTVVEVKTRVTGPLSRSLTGLAGIDFVVGEKAHGGAVSAGSPFLVGERGPELFVPDRSGTIVPNNVLNQSSQRSVTVEINGAVFGSDVDVQAAVQAGLIAGGVTESVEWAGTTTIR